MDTTPTNDLDIKIDVSPYFKQGFLFKGEYSGYIGRFTQGSFGERFTVFDRDGKTVEILNLSVNTESKYFSKEQIQEIKGFY